ncbi:uncharacterized protein PEZ65_014617 isoform 2-T2 [Lycodopsis pacificus]
MDFQTCLKACFTILITVSCTANSLECPRTNISCKDIYSGDRFTFLHRCPKGSEISVFDNKTLVAYAVLGNQMTNHLNEVIIGDHSVDTRDCRDLKIRCMVPIGETGVDEICLDYKVTGEAMRETPTPTLMPTPTPTPTPRNHIISWSVFGFAGLMVLIGVFGYISWKKKQHVASIGSWILRHMRISSPAEMRQTEQTRLSEVSARHPLEGGENDTEQDNALESVHVPSIDPTADGKAPQSSGLDRNSSYQGIQPTASLRDDPGGMKDNDGKAIDGIREVCSRWTVGDRAPEDHGNEGQPLLSNQRAANHGFDMTAKAVALVDKRGIDPDQVSRCSPVPDADVESTPNMNN